MKSLKIFIICGICMIIGESANYLFTGLQWPIPSLPMFWAGMWYGIYLQRKT